MTVGVSLITQPKSDEELRGLVWGLTRKEEEPEEHDPADDVWYRSPYLLAGGALGLVVILSIVFI